MRLVSTSVACLWLFSVLAFGQTASLTGKMIDITGAVVPGVSVRLESEQDHSKNISTDTDANGNWSFTNLLPGEYVLVAFRKEFFIFTVRDIKIVDDKRTTLPPLQMSVASLPCQGGGPTFTQFIDDETRTGEFRGSIELDLRNGQGIAGAEVKLLCGKRKVCGTTTTNQDGKFRFTGLSPGRFNLEVSRTGFYPRKEAGYRVYAGLEAVYFPIHLEKCFRGDCSPSKRPKKPVGLCE